MKQSVFKILENEKIAADVFKMTLSGDISEITAPGQFVNIKLNGFLSSPPYIRVRRAGRRADPYLQNGRRRH